jgi:hypothetical protein
MGDGPDMFGMAGGVIARDFPAPVARTIVGDDQLPIGKGLRQHAVDRLGQIAIPVIDDDDGADPGRA